MGKKVNQDDIPVAMLWEEIRVANNLGPKPHWVDVDMGDDSRMKIRGTGNNMSNTDALMIQVIHVAAMYHVS